MVSCIHVTSCQMDSISQTQNQQNISKSKVSVRNRSFNNLLSVYKIHNSTNFHIKGYRWYCMISFNVTTWWIIYYVPTSQVVDEMHERPWYQRFIVKRSKTLIASNWMKILWQSHLLIKHCRGDEAESKAFIVSFTLCQFKYHIVIVKKLIVYNKIYLRIPYQ